MQNKPSANGTPGGPAVGTGKQRKQVEMVEAVKRAEKRVIKKVRTHLSALDLRQS